MGPSSDRRPVRDDLRAFVAETRFSGAIVTCSWPRDEVARLLPPSLRLGPAPRVSRTRHPVVFIFGEHDQSKVLFASLAIPTGVRFLECVVAVPYVRTVPGTESALFVYRVFSGEPVVTWSGNAHYGYAKRMVPMEWLGDTFVVNDEQGRLLAHARVFAVGPWQRAVSDARASTSLARLGQLPVLGARSDGALVKSHFDWALETSGFARHARMCRCSRRYRLDPPHASRCLGCGGA